MGKILLGKYLVFYNPNDREVVTKRDWGVAINGGLIEEIDENDLLLERYGSYEHFDFRDRIICPGFVNAHMHSYGILSHGIRMPDNVIDFEKFLNDFWWPKIENRIDHKMIEATTRYAAWELINSGVTTFCDVLEAPNAIPGALDVEANILKDIGMRAVLSFEASERIDLENGLNGLDENRKFILSHKNDSLISGKMCIHTTFTCSPDFIKRARKISDELGCGVQMHLSESSYEPDFCNAKYGMSPTELYDKLEFLKEDVLISQGVQLNDNEMDIIKKRSANLVHVPLSNCEVGGGIAPVPRMIEKGINVSLGTDGYINNFFEVMRGAFLIHKANRRDPRVMDAKTVFDMATLNGGVALNKDIGVIKPGAFADIIVIRADTPTPIDEDNIYLQLLLYRNPEDVSEVFINGEVVKEDGRLIGCDWGILREELQGQVKRLWDN